MMRENIKSTDTVRDMIVTMAEGNPGAITVLMEILKSDKDTGVFNILHMDDMNIRGTQIWIGYKDFCKQDILMFLKYIKERNRSLIDYINATGKLGNHKDMAVPFGGSYPGGRKMLGE